MVSFTGEQIYTTDFADEATVARWNAVTGAGPEVLFTLPAEMTIPQLHLSEDAGHLIVCCCDGLVLVYDLSTGERMETTGLRRTGWIHMLGGRITADSIGDAAWVIGE